MLAIFWTLIPPPNSHYTGWEMQYPLLQIFHPKSSYAELAEPQRNANNFRMPSLNNRSSHHHSKVLITCSAFSEHELMVWDVFAYLLGPYLFCYLPPPLDCNSWREGTVLLILASPLGAVSGTKYGTKYVFSTARWAIV